MALLHTLYVQEYIANCGMWSVIIYIHIYKYIKPVKLSGTCLESLFTFWIAAERDTERDKERDTHRKRDTQRDAHRETETERDTHREMQSFSWSDTGAPFVHCCKNHMQLCPTHKTLVFKPSNVALQTFWVSVHKVIQLLSFMVCNQLVPIRGDNSNNYKAT